MHTTAYPLLVVVHKVYHNVQHVVSVTTTNRLFTSLHPLLLLVHRSIHTSMHSKGVMVPCMLLHTLCV